MRNFTLGIGLALLAVLAGCATTATPPQAAHHVAAQAFATSSTGAGTLVVTRDEGFTGSACSVLLQVNGSAIAELGAGDTATLYPPAGEIVLRLLAPTTGLCSFSSLDVQRETLVKAGEVKRFRILIPGSGPMDIQRAE